jgi:hypothetical protein
MMDHISCSMIEVTIGWIYEPYLVDRDDAI